MKFCIPIIFESEDDLILAYTPALPGVTSYGKDEAEARKNICEALTGAIEMYMDEGVIPWQQCEPPSTAKWMLLVIE